jgi:hypothetical protein
VTAQLAYLRDKRVVRKFGEEDRYELAHEVLVNKVWAWISDDELRRLEVRDMLGRELSNYRKFRHLLTPEKLALINSGGDGWKLTPEELELLFRSALTLGDASAPEWFARAQEAELPVEAIAQEGLKSDHFFTRAAAVKMLAQFGPQFMSGIIDMLADEYPQPRVAAIQALEKLQPTGEWREHLKYECYVPAGPFIMGDDKSIEKDEKPAHEVTLAAFYMGKYPVTNADYKRYMDDLKRAFDIPGGKDQHPVVSVSWYDARDYTAWAAMRLPTEAQWEKAASWEESDRGIERLRDRGIVQRLKSSVLKAGEKAAGKKRVYPWGDEFDKSKCNTSDSNIGTTTPVGAYSPQGDSAYGCADMTGNVCEWTSSLKRDYPYRAEDGREDQSSSDPRVLRGGAFDLDEWCARCASRDRLLPDFRLGYLGVRLVVSPF